MGKNLIITTNSFPNEKGEPFLLAEFPFLQSEMGSIVANPYQATSVNERKHCPVLTLSIANNSVKRLLVKYWKSLFSAYLLELIRSKKPLYYIKNLKRFYNIWIGWIQQAEAWELELKKHNPEDTIIYSYWYENQAVPLTILRSRGKLPFHWVSRAHGWDVDKRQRANGIIPFRHWMLKNPPDQLVSISDFGSKIFSRDYAAQSIVYRLGTADMGLADNNEFDTLKIVTISSLIALKRVDLILSALQKVKHPILLTIYGDGPDRSTLESMKTPDYISVNFKGHKEHSKMLQEIKGEGYDLMVHTSSLEGIPVSIMECMSMGIPAMACDTGGVAELVDDDNGWLLPVDINSEELAEKLDYLALNKEILDPKRINARAKWKKDYQASVNFPRFIEEVLLSPAK